LREKEEECLEAARLAASYTGKPLLRGDMVEFTGTVGPLVTYDSLTGSRTIPTVRVTGSHLLQ